MTKSNLCERCGITDPRVLVDHHIKPRAEGGSDDSANIVTLCRNCHVIVHGELKAKQTTQALINYSLIPDFEGDDEGVLEELIPDIREDKLTIRFPDRQRKVKLVQTPYGVLMKRRPKPKGDKA